MEELEDVDAYYEYLAREREKRIVHLKEVCDTTDVKKLKEALEKSTECVEYLKSMHDKALKDVRERYHILIKTPTRIEAHRKHTSAYVEERLIKSDMLLEEARKSHLEAVLQMHELKETENFLTENG